MVQREFDKHAKTYRAYNQIQQSVAKELFCGIRGKPERILDLGCGSGLVYEQIEWDIDYFCGIDFAPSMLSLHPASKISELLCADFDTFDWVTLAKEKNVSHIVSSSSLQWSKDFQTLLHKLNTLNIPFSFALFTGNTFADFHHRLHVQSPIYSRETLDSFMDSYSGKKYYKTYLLEFETKQKMLHFLKAGGVSGGLNKVGIKVLREFLKSDFNAVLEFEVMYFHSSPPCL